MRHLSFLTMPRVVLSFALIAVAAGCGSTVNGGAGNGGSGDGGGGAGGGTTSIATCSAGTSRACTPSGAPFETGTQECVLDDQGHTAWSACSDSTSTASTPLVLSFDSAPVDFRSTAGAFDINGTMSVATDWPAAATPWLALDRNGNGAIDDGSELFGSATSLRSGERASNGFVALAELDANGDGRITQADPAWASLRLWSDGDGDRVSSARELSSLEARGITSIDLSYTVEPRCDARRNCEIEKATFRWVDEAGVERRGTIVDVHLRHQ